MIFLFYRVDTDSFALLDKSQKFSDFQIEQRLKELSNYCKKYRFMIDDIPIHLILTSALTYCNSKNMLHYIRKILQEARDNHKFIVKFTLEDNISTTNHSTNIWWTRELNNILTSKRFYPFFQPIVNTFTKEVYKYEALIRYVNEKGREGKPLCIFRYSKKYSFVSINYNKLL